jgi:hypothetical protein
VGGFALLIPTVVMKRPKAYWLFLLALSIPFASQNGCGWSLVDPESLVDLYGNPGSGTVAIEPYLTDIVGSGRDPARAAGGPRQGRSRS